MTRVLINGQQYEFASIEIGGHQIGAVREVKYGARDTALRAALTLKMAREDWERLVGHFMTPGLRRAPLTRYWLRRAEWAARRANRRRRRGR